MLCNLCQNIQFRRYLELTREEKIELLTYWDEWPPDAYHEDEILSNDAGSLDSTNLFTSIIATWNRYGKRQMTVVISATKYSTGYLKPQYLITRSRIVPRVCTSIFNHLVSKDPKGNIFIMEISTCALERPL
jgi:hypothetical protein